MKRIQIDKYLLSICEPLIQALSDISTFALFFNVKLTQCFVRQDELELIPF